MTITIDDILAKLRKHHKLKGCGLYQWDACCPAHEDRNRSMRVYLCEDGKLRFRCYAGCTYQAIRAALGLPVGEGAIAPSSWAARHAAEPRPAPRYNFSHLHNIFAEDVWKVAELAVQLGVSAQSLMTLGVGWCENYLMYVRSRDRECPVTAWTFPMVNAAAVATGLRLRYANGEKGSWTDTQAGLFLPVRWLGGGPLLIVEGPTDAAAVLDWGFDVIGRPSCNDGNDLILALLKVFKRDVVILSNLDEPKHRPDGSIFYPGQEGAAALADQILWRCPTLRVITPPSGIKDARQWLNAGGTRRDVEAVISSKGQWRPTKRKTA